MIVLFTAGLGLLFIGLKLTGFIAWSWWFVLLPIYLLPAAALTCFTIAGIIWLTMTKEERARHRAKTSLEEYAAALGKRRF
jgi:hypothetical protein